MKKKFWRFVDPCLILLALITLCSVCSEKKPFRNLDAAEIVSASVWLSPPDETVPIMNLNESADYLHEIVIYQEDNTYTMYEGQGCVLTMTKTDGTRLQVMAYNPFVIIDSVGYKCRYEPCDALCRYANRLLHDA
ncbi:MAG: hypothetical protein LUF91_05010 [Oscillospiraceae bacterium]|nr:hypothetical protein [Oscillospiraceae bacterium]